MQCPRCRAENREGRRFCGECGLSFASACPSCGFLNEGNSGDVVVRSIGSDLRMDYTAVGQTTHLAARMEQLAAPAASGSPPRRPFRISSKGKGLEG